MNTGASAVDLSAYSFSGISFVFPEGTMINGGQRLVLANNGSQKSWIKRYPGVTPVGWYGKNLSDTGERIALLDATGRTVFSVTYEIANGWPTLANGQGYSLEMMDVNGDPNDPANWRASTAPNGTPGQPPAAPAIAASVIINEVMAENVSAVANAGTYPDWVELFNSSSNEVDLTGWSLSDNGNPRQFVFPATHLAAGGFLVVWCDDATNTSPGLHAGFALNKDGETVALYDNVIN
ncbi:MAG: lamin tail domain-containing protein, partial [Verrucomicrobia bacterium]|nr:lamin tail domain-containing protein [Verrucomicrobiota bacterium]